MPTTCELPAELTIYTVGEVYPQCLAWLDAADREGASDVAADGRLNVGAAAVGEVDAAGVQLLLSLSNALVRQQRRLHLVAPSESLRAACAVLGADALLEGAR